MFVIAYEGPAGKRYYVDMAASGYFVRFGTIDEAARFATKEEAGRRCDRFPAAIEILCEIERLCECGAPLPYGGHVATPACDACLSGAR